MWDVSLSDLSELLRVRLFSSASEGHHSVIHHEFINIYCVMHIHILNTKNVQNQKLDFKHLKNCTNLHHGLCPSRLRSLVTSQAVNYT